MKRLILVSTLALSMTAGAAPGERGALARDGLVRTIARTCLVAQGVDQQECEASEQRVFSGLRRFFKGYDLYKNPKKCANNPDYFPVVYKGSLESLTTLIKGFSLQGCVDHFTKSLNAEPLHENFVQFNEKTDGKGVEFLKVLTKYHGKPATAAEHIAANNIIHQSVAFNEETNRYELIKAEDGTVVLYEKIKTDFNPES